MKLEEESIDSEKTADSANIKNLKIITLGNCSLYYLLFLGSGIARALSLILLGYNENNKDFGLFGFCPTFNNYNFIQSIIIYFGYIIFGIIFLFFKDVKKEEINEISKKNFTIKRTMIEAEASKKKDIKSKIQIFFFCLFLILNLEIRKMLYIFGFQSFHIWTIEILFIIYFMRKYFIINIFIHHKVSIIFIISICSILLLIESFLPNSLLAKHNGNAYQNIYKNLGSKFYSILFIFIFFISSLIHCFSSVFTKNLIQIKFISPYKIILIIGTIGFFLCIVASIVSSYTKYNDNCYAYFSAMKEVLKDKPYKFWVEILCVYPLFSFINYLGFTFKIFIIYYLNPVYILLENTLYYFIDKISTFLFNISGDGPKIAHFILALFSDIFAALGYMVYLEILELNFCGLNKYIKRRLMKKGEREFKTLSLVSMDIIDKNNNNNDENDEDGDKDTEKTEPLYPY